MKLRAIEESDLAVLREHRNRLDTRRFLGDARPVTEAGQFVWWRLHDTASYRIAQQDGIDVGIVRVTDVTSTGACVGADVFSEHRGRGFGHLVFESACYAARERARDAWLKSRALQSPPPPDSWYPATLTLWLRVFVENTAAMRIYTKADFEVDANDPVQVYCRQTRHDGAYDMLHYVRMTKLVPSLPLKENV